MEDALKTLKEFIWDIIGYLIPGFLLIILFNLIFLPTVSIKNDFIFEWNLFYPYIIIVIAYCLGYVVYGLTIFKINVQDSLIERLKYKFWASSHSKYWEQDFMKSPTLNSTKTFLKNNGYVDADIDKMSLSELRNILMSRDPSMDQKIYTFMFRSSMFDHISTISILLLIVVILQVLLSCFFSVIFIRTETIFIVFYIIIVFLIPILGKCKRIFYSIAKRLSFSNLK